jgi:hypothetical protein
MAKFWTYFSAAAVFLGVLIRETIGDAAIRTIEGKVAERLGVEEAAVVAYVTTYGIPLVVLWFCARGIYRAGQSSTTPLNFFPAIWLPSFLRYPPKPSVPPSIDRAYQPVNWPLRTLFSHLAPELPLTAHKKIGTAVVDDIDKHWIAIGAIIQKQLSLGNLHAFGRRRERTRRLHAEPIPAEFWRDAKFTYWFLDAEPSIIQDAHNDETSYSEIEVNSAEAIAIWPVKDVPLFDAATCAYERIQHTDSSIAMEVFANSSDEILTSICDAFAKFQGGKEPLVRLRGNHPPSRLIEEIYMAPLNKYEFSVEGKTIILQNKGSRYENLSVKSDELDRAIATFIDRHNP